LSGDRPSPDRFSFSEKEQIARTMVLVLIKAQDERGVARWAYAAVPANNMEKLMKAQCSGKPYFLQDYGKILDAGEGEPTAEAKRRMEEKYGFDHEKTVMLSEE